jgi:hypothetical protein
MMEWKTGVISMAHSASHSTVDHWNEKEFSMSVQFAGFAKRLKAFAFDFVSILAYIIVLFGLTMGVINLMAYFRRPLHLPEYPLLGDLIAFLTLLLPVILYFT